MDQIFLGEGTEKAYFSLSKMNRHGLITGATGTGKTVTVKVLAEELSLRGVPVFVADVKGDLASLSEKGEASPEVEKRLDAMGLDEDFAAFPVTLFDVFGHDGIPIRAGVSEMGPLLLSRLLELNEVQEGVLNIAFDVADKEGLLLIDTKDLKAMLTEISDNSNLYKRDYGNISSASVGAIIRRLVVLEREGADIFFGEPAIDVRDFLTVENGMGMINILNATKLFQKPRLYATFLLALLSKLYDALPEIGDVERPKLVFFFDEAHLIFDGAPKPLLEKLLLTVRLIRSKGVGVFFATQNPADIPDEVLAQLGNKIQHALRVYTPREEKKVRAAADSFRAPKDMDVARVIQELAVGEALVSTLDAGGAPTEVVRVFVRPPRSKIGTIDPMHLEKLISDSPLYEKYVDAYDPVSAYEMLTEEVEKRRDAEEEAKRMKEEERLRREEARAKREKDAAFNRSFVGRVKNSATNQIGREIGRQIIRGILGTLKFR